MRVKPHKATWDTIKGKLPEELVKYMGEEWGKEWFKIVRKYRNMAAHYSYLWTGQWKVRWGNKNWDYSEHGVSIHYLDDTEELKEEKVNVCPDYLKKMVSHIHQVWEMMAQEFQ